MKYFKSILKKCWRSKKEKECYYFWDALNLCWITGCMGIMRMPEGDYKIPVRVCPYCGGKIVSNHIKEDAK